MQMRHAPFAQRCPPTREKRVHGVSATLTNPLILLGLAVVMLMTGPLAEELGRRGRALPRPQDRSGWLLATLGLEGGREP